MDDTIDKRTYVEDSGSQAKQPEKQQPRKRYYEYEFYCDDCPFSVDDLNDAEIETAIEDDQEPSQDTSMDADMLEQETAIEQ